VRCIERLRLSALAGVLLLASCSQTPAPAPVPATRPAPAPAPAATAPPALPAPPRARNWDDFKRAAALRLVAANPGRTYDGPAPDPLLAIPVLEIELDSEGRIRRIVVLREPRQAKDTTQLAIDAVRRAAPFGPVGHLKQPWKFAEVFLFDDDRKFKPRTLEE
jgi:hypothetical protein